MPVRIPTLLMLSFLIGALLVCQGAGKSRLETRRVTGSQAKTSVRSQSFRITPVEGPSWISHLRIDLQQTAMGKTGDWGPPAYEETEYPQWALKLPPDLFSKTLALSGSDLYRLDCQGCHQADGKGVPPEINSLLDPVRATSATLVRQRMAKVGAAIGPKAARQLASQAEASLLERLGHGGQKMPSFPDLNPTEVRALVAYLKHLAGVPGAERQQIRIEEPVARVGEHLVKATCHICHGASGPRPDPEQLLRGAVPPLSALPKYKTLGEFVRKVTEGSPVTMGALELEYRGRMPVFYYVSNEEAAAAYLYLSLYLPKE